MFGTGVRLAGNEPLEQKFRLIETGKLNESTLLARYARIATND